MDGTGIEVVHPIKSNQQNLISDDNHDKKVKDASPYSDMETNQDELALIPNVNNETIAEKREQNEECEEKQDIKCFLESVYQDLDKIILDANHNPTTPNLSLNHGLLLYKIKSQNDTIETKNQRIQVYQIIFYNIV